MFFFFNFKFGAHRSSLESWKKNYLAPLSYQGTDLFVKISNWPKKFVTQILYYVEVNSAKKMGANAIYFLSKGQCASKNIYINRVPTCCKMTDLQQECFEAHECTNAMWICDVKKKQVCPLLPTRKGNHKLAICHNYYW